MNGANLGIPRQRRARINASQDPLMAEWAFEVAKGAVDARLTRAQADAVLRKLYALIQGQPVERGVEHIRECYDLVNHRPSPDYLRIYLQLKEELARLGLVMNQ